MSIEMNVTKQILKEKIHEAKKFFLDDLLDEVEKQGGSFNVSANYTIEDYLDLLEDVGIIQYDPSNDSYIIFHEKIDVFKNNEKKNSFPNN
jgi:hypothetical protein